MIADNDDDGMNSNSSSSSSKKRGEYDNFRSSKTLTNAAFYCCKREPSLRQTVANIGGHKVRIIFATLRRGSTVKNAIFATLLAGSKLDFFSR